MAQFRPRRRAGPTVGSGTGGVRMSGPVDRYLDELFDRLAGTGSAGRRVLVEAEDHLRTATAEGVQRGLSSDDAEREAVTRFGPAARVGTELRMVHLSLPALAR